MPGFEFRRGAMPLASPTRTRSCVRYTGTLHYGTRHTPRELQEVDSVVMVPDATTSSSGEMKLSLLPTLSALSLCSLVLTRYFLPLQHGRSNISTFADPRTRARSEKLSSQHSGLSLFKRVLYHPWPPSTIQFSGGNMRHSQRRRFQNQPSARVILHCLRTSGLIHRTCLGQLGSGPNSPRPRSSSHVLARFHTVHSRVRASRPRDYVGSCGL